MGLKIQWFLVQALVVQSIYIAHNIMSDFENTS